MSTECVNCEGDLRGGCDCTLEEIKAAANRFRSDTSSDLVEQLEALGTVCYEVGWQHAKGIPSDIAEASREEIWESLEAAIKSLVAEHTLLTERASQKPET